MRKTYFDPTDSKLVGTPAGNRLVYCDIVFEWNRYLDLIESGQVIAAFRYIGFPLYEREYQYALLIHPQKYFSVEMMEPCELQEIKNFVFFDQSKKKYQIYADIKDISRNRYVLEANKHEFAAFADIMADFAFPEVTRPLPAKKVDADTVMDYYEYVDANSHVKYLPTLAENDISWKLFKLVPLLLQFQPWKISGRARVEYINYTPEQLRKDPDQYTFRYHDR